MKRAESGWIGLIVCGLLGVAAPGQAGLVTSFEVSLEPGLQVLPPATELPPLPDTVDLDNVELRFIPPDGFAIPFPDGTNTMTIGAGAAIATVGLPDFYAADGGIYELAFPGEIWFDRPVTDLSFTFWSLIEGANGGFASVQAFDAGMNPLGGPVFPNDLLLDGAGIEDLVFFGGPVSHLVWTITGMPGLGEGWGIDRVSASTIPEPTTALLLGLGTLVLGSRRQRRVAA